MIDEDVILRLHRGPAGEVWAAAGRQAPAAVASDVRGFLQAAAWGDFQVVRLLGCLSNASLIAGLWLHATPPRQTQVASPQVCQHRAELGRPEIALWRARQCLLSPSLGGWHTLTAADAVSYTMATLPDGSDRRACLPQHPAWAAISFLQPCDLAAVAELLAAVLDPRWFLDPNKPERISRAQAFLGQTPGVPKSAATAHRRQLVRQAWYGSGQPDIAAPGAFLWRRYLKAGELKAGRTFTAYLLRAWQAELVRQQSAVPVDSLFAPDLLLSPSELLAFRQHTQAANL